MTSRRQLAATFGPAYAERQAQHYLDAGYGRVRHGRAALRARRRRRRRAAAHLAEPWRGFARHVHTGMTPLGAILRRMTVEVDRITATLRRGFTPRTPPVFDELRGYLERADV